MPTHHHDPVLDQWRAEARRTLSHLSPDVREEIAQHAAERWHAARARGMADVEADALARAELREWSAVRLPRVDRRGWRALFVGAGVDARSARRALGRRPGSALAAVALAAVAVGAGVATFALAYGILWRPLPYPDAGRLSVVWTAFRGEDGQVSYPDYADFRDAPVFDGTAAIMGGRGSVRVGAGDDVERVNALEIEPSGYALLGAVPAAGRLLNAADTGSDAAMISHRFWQRHYGGDPAAVGRTIWLSGTTHTIVGVLADGFDFEMRVGTFELENHDIWMPFDTANGFITRREVTTYEVLARRAPGVSAEEAQASLNAIAARLERAHPATNTGRGFRLVGLRDHVVAEVRPALLLLLVAAALTFAIALANLATLTLVRLAGRQTELAVRDALGAGRLRLRSQILFENLALSGLGAGLGLLLARLAVRAVVSSDAANLPRPDAVRFDAPVFAVAVLLGATIAVVLSLLPIRTVRGADSLRGASRASSPGSRLVRRTLVPAELAMALALSAGGALLALSLVQLLSIDPGFATTHVAAARLSAYQSRYPDKAATTQFFDRVVATLAEHAQVNAAAASSSLPLSGHANGTSVEAEGRPVDPADPTTAGWQVVTPGYFRAAGIPLLAGRDFVAADRPRAEHVTILSESLARRLFPGGDALGRRIATGGDVDDWHEVVGIVGDVRHSALAGEARPRVYDLSGQHWSRTMFVVVRGHGPDASPTIPIVRSEVRALDAEAPLFEAATLGDLVRRSVGTRMLASRAAMGLAGVAVLIALLGVYGVVAAGVAERTRELGIRIALGASPRALVRRVLADQAFMLAGGTFAGLAGCAAVARLLGSLLYGVDAGEAIAVSLSMALGLAIAALAAAFVPARRTGLVDPITALRD